MKRSLLLSLFALAIVAMTVGQSTADTLQLTLDLKNALKADPLGGGTWQLYVRKIEGAGGVNGDNGVAGVRALINNIAAGSVTFGTGINHSITCNGGGPCVQTLPNGTVEIVYGQNISAAGVVTTVGIPQTGQAATRDTLIASGSWPAGPRPIFGDDGASPTPFTSEGNFLGAAASPFGNSIEASGANVATSIVTLGDFTSNNIINNLDAVQFLRQIPGSTNPAPYNPAGDIANPQNGIVNNLDAVQFLNILGGPSSAAISVVPEPSTVGLAVIAAMGLIARRRRV